MPLLARTNAKLIAAVIASSTVFTDSCMPRKANQSGASRQKLIGGEPVGPAEFPSTFYITEGCTGTKIGPRHILTAAHCVTSDLFHDINPKFITGASQKIDLIIDRQFSAADSEHSRLITVNVVKTNVYPDYWQGLTSQDSGRNQSDDGPIALRAPYPSDLAVIEVSDDMAAEARATRFSEIPVAPVTSLEDTERNNTGSMNVQILGYGCEVSNTALRTGPVRLKVANSVQLNVNDIKGMAGYQSIDFKSLQAKYILTPGVSLPRSQEHQATPSVASLCSGDSGGPVFTNTKRGTLALIAVNSFGSRDGETAKPGISTFNGHALIDVDWLKSIGAVSK